jgi:threonine synthase
MTVDAPAEARRGALEFTSKVLEVPGDLSDVGRLAQEYADATGAFNLATLREPYRVEGKKTILFEIWEALQGMPDWILFPAGGGTGVVGAWKALQELRQLGWYEGAAPRLGFIQAEGCAPLVEAWRTGRDRTDPWKDPRTDAAGLRVPATIGDRLLLQAVRDTEGAGVPVSDEAMAVAAANLATLEGISACPEGAATLAGLRRLYDEGTIRPSDRVVLVNTGVSRATGHRARLPRAGSREEALQALGRRLPSF